MEDPAAVAAAERKKKRLEAWRKRQQQQQEKSTTAAAPKAPPIKLSLALGGIKNKKKKKSKSKKSVRPITSNPFQDDGDLEKHETATTTSRQRSSRAMGFDLDNDEDDGDDDAIAEHLSPPPLEDHNASSKMSSSNNNNNSIDHDNEPPTKKRRKRWDNAPAPVQEPSLPTKSVHDALDKFMEKLEAGAMGNVATQESANNGENDGTSLTINVAGSMTRHKEKPPGPSPVSGGVITPEMLAQLASTSSGNKNSSRKATAPADALYTASDWESDAHHGGSASESEMEDEEEEMARQALINALKQAPGLATEKEEEELNQPIQLAAEVKSEKHRREEKLKQLERDAEAANEAAAAAAAPEFGRLYNDAEGGVMEEAQRNLDAATAAPDALEVLAELNKKKELKAVDHSKVDYIPFRKNLYIVPRSVANLSSDDIADRRAKMKVKVRGRGAPAPVATFEECGLSEKVLGIMSKQNISKPYPVQAQCLPCIMAGRDVIGIAKTGSGKTLAYFLPMIRHITDQPPLGPTESGPIGLILAPARELAAQIHTVCKMFTKHLGLKSTAVYGGAAVAGQIADLKRGTHIAVATPGRLIDILTMQAGKILSLQRVSYVVMDEADRMFDMGFAPQISAILAAVRPDRQTVLFSATFPKSVENLARKSLKFPIEVLVGGRSVASDNVTQYAEVVEEEDKFLRLLQLLGEHVDEGKKVLIFVDTQAKTDSIFEQLMRCGYPSLSLHGGKEQEDRDATISDFKGIDGLNVMVATSVAGRGLDVSSLACVVNYSSPNHLEDYVHRVGRTGRAANRGVAYTFVNSTDEAKFAPIIVRALSEAGQSENISPTLKELAESFKEKVKKGEARWAGSGFKGKGYSYDSSELSEAQKLARAEKRQALIEAGLLDPDEQDPSQEELTNKAVGSDATEKEAAEAESGDKSEEKVKISAELLALPGMHDALMKKVGMGKDGGESAYGTAVQTGPNHFVLEFEINDYPREARWKVTQKDTTSRLQDEFQTAVTLKGEYFASDREPGEGERKLYLHLEATSERILQNCVIEIRRLLNEETLRVGTRGIGGGGSHKYSVLG